MALSHGDIKRLHRDTMIVLTPGRVDLTSPNMHYSSDSTITTIIKMLDEKGDSLEKHDVRVFRFDSTIAQGTIPHIQLNGQIMVIGGKDSLTVHQNHTSFFKILIIDDEAQTPPAGIKENNRLEDNVINMYPNPNDGKFTVDLDLLGNQDATLNINDAQGRMVYTKRITRPRGKVQEQVDLSGVSPGVYFVTVEQNGKSLVKKVSIW